MCVGESREVSSGVSGCSGRRECNISAREGNEIRREESRSGDREKAAATTAAAAAPHRPLSQASLSLTFSVIVTVIIMNRAVVVAAAGGSEGHAITGLSLHMLSQQLLLPSFPASRTREISAVEQSARSKGQSNCP